MRVKTSIHSEKIYRNIYKAEILIRGSVSQSKSFKSQEKKKKKKAEKERCKIYDIQ